MSETTKPRKNWPLRICFLFVIGSAINGEWLWFAGLAILWVLWFSVTLARQSERDASKSPAHDQAAGNADRRAIRPGSGTL